MADGQGSRDADSAKGGNISALNLTCTTTATTTTIIKSKKDELPERGTWSSKVDFILSVVS